MLKKFIYGFAIVIISISPSYANYNANIAGEVTAVMTYSNGLVLFKLKNQPATHPQCNSNFFAIAIDVPEASANRMLSRLLTAHTTKVPVNIGFDNAGGCGDGYIRVYRIG